MNPPSRPNLAASPLIELCQELLTERRLLLISNRGPAEYKVGADGSVRLSRGAGGVVTALSAISKYVELTWIASAMGEGDRRTATENNGRFLVELPGQRLFLRFVTSPRNVYHKYYNLFCNPLLWFLQHYMWYSPYTPNVDAKVYDAWHNGYVTVNRDFADAAVAEAAADKVPPFIMIHDYQLYLVGGFIRKRLPQAILQHFVHIPWPSSSYWQLFPGIMRNSILESLCAVDIVGLQTKRDVHNFLHSCEVFLEGATVDYSACTVSLAGHKTRVSAYPVSIDVQALHRLARSPRVHDYGERLKPHLCEKTIVRVDRAEPSKNIIRGLKAYDTLLERSPDLLRRVKLVCFLVPSRSGIKQYQRYAQDIFELVTAINDKYGDSEWQPIKVYYENNYAQAIAGMRLCDVLFVNPIIDGMNLVAKEGPIVSAKNSVLVLSEAAGAHEQLRAHALSVSPADIEGTVQALSAALTMDELERRRRAGALRKCIEEEDITRWLYQQFQDLRRLACQLPLLLPV
ncbi:MAG: trehalose-6-phosphate synthase [Dehalococcoidia bacterium]|nr:trehalose-6-phosphate synthase [Dehalococcoidia bacterium]